MDNISYDSIKPIMDAHDDETLQSIAIAERNLQDSIRILRNTIGDVETTKLIQGLFESIDKHLKLPF